MSINEYNVKNIVLEACKQLVANDKYLLIYNLNERTITHKLAEYLQKKFPYFHVDCEYNKDSDKVKRIKFRRNLVEKKITNFDTEGCTIYPDIIVHKRGSNDNLVAIEVKKNASIQLMEKDIEKIKWYKHDLGYKFGIFINFLTEEEPSLKNNFFKIKVI
jgi:hypothetical protein